MQNVIIQTIAQCAVLLLCGGIIGSAVTAWWMQRPRRNRKRNPNSDLPLGIQRL